MNTLIEITNITMLNEILGVSKPRHPLVTIVDLSKAEIPEQTDNVRAVLNFYCITLKRGCSDALQYGRGYYDFQEGTLIAMGPGQVIGMESDASERKLEGFALYFHPDLLIKHN